MGMDADQTPARDAGACTNGATTFEALNSTLARARYGCEAITRS